MLEHTASRVTEIMPWEYEDYLSDNPTALFVDVRETQARAVNLSISPAPPQRARLNDPQISIYAC